MQTQQKSLCDCVTVIFYFFRNPFWKWNFLFFRETKERKLHCLDSKIMVLRASQPFSEWPVLPCRRQNIQEVRPSLRACLCISWSPHCARTVLSLSLCDSLCWNRSAHELLAPVNPDMYCLRTKGSLHSFQIEILEAFLSIMTKRWVHRGLENCVNGQELLESISMKTAAHAHFAIENLSPYEQICALAWIHQRYFKVAGSFWRWKNTKNSKTPHSWSDIIRIARSPEI